MYLFEELKYFNHFMLTEDFKSQTNFHRFLFAFVSIYLKAAFKNTSIKKVHMGENFKGKYKLWDKIAKKLILVLCYFF